MKQQLLTRKTLPSYATGELETRFNDLLVKLCKDCIERPGIDKARTLTLKVTLHPKKKDDGTADDVIVAIGLETRGPGFPMSPYLMRATANGGLRFQPESPMDPDQPGLDFGEGGGD